MKQARYRIAATLSPLLGALMLAACADPPPLYVDQAWVKLNANPEAPAAGYFVVHGGAEAVDLRGVITDRALRVELHESAAGNGGMIEMKPIEKAAIPAKTPVSFAPGGKHLMLWGVNKEAIGQGKLPLTFLFSNGDRIIVDAVIRKAGGAGTPPAPEKMSEDHSAAGKAH